MKFTVTISTIEPLYGLFTYIEDVLLDFNSPHVVFTLDGLKKIIVSKYSTVTTKQIQQAIIYLASRRDRDYCDIYRIKKNTYKYINYTFKLKTITVS